jgi:hypothetical protein
MGREIFIMNDWESLSDALEDQKEIDTTVYVMSIKEKMNRLLDYAELNSDRPKQL